MPIHQSQTADRVMLARSPNFADKLRTDGILSKMSSSHGASSLLEKIRDRYFKDQRAEDAIYTTMLRVKVEFFGNEQSFRNV